LWLGIDRGLMIVQVVEIEELGSYVMLHASVEPDSS